MPKLSTNYQEMYLLAHNSNLNNNECVLEYRHLDKISLSKETTLLMLIDTLIVNYTPNKIYAITFINARV